MEIWFAKWLQKMIDDISEQEEFNQKYKTKIKKGIFFTTYEYEERDINLPKLK